MAVKVSLHRRARADLSEIANYLRRQADGDAAERVREHLRARILKLGTMPQLGIRTAHPEIRTLSPTKYPYRIYFVHQRGGIIVLHVRHTARDLPDLDDLI